MSKKNINSVVAVISVKDHAGAVTWYNNLFGRNADLEPTEGVSEWQITESAWIQISFDPESSGGSSVIIGVDDIDKQRNTCFEAGLIIGEIVEYPGIIKMADIVDLEGNKIVFVQDISK